MNKLILVLILSVALIAFSQTAIICSANSHCNDYSTLDDKVCEVDATDPLLNKCTTRTGLDFKTTTTDPKGRCKDSLNFGTTNHVCGAYAMPECDVPDADVAYLKCIDSSYDSTTKKCKVPSGTGVVVRTFVGEGARCDLRSTKQVYCGDNLACIDNVCRAKLAPYDNCQTGTGALVCKNGYVCDGDECVPERTVYEGNLVKTFGPCRGGLNAFGWCLDTKSVPCYHNGDCPSLGFQPAEVCYKKSGAVVGVCTQSIPAALVKLSACKRDSLSAITAAKPNNVGCEKQLTEFVCATECKKRPDLRIPNIDSSISQEGTAFTYNCATMTRTAIAAGTCLVKELVTGCPAIPIGN